MLGARPHDTIIFGKHHPTKVRPCLTTKVASCRRVSMMCNQFRIVYNVQCELITMWHPVEANGSLIRWKGAMGETRQWVVTSFKPVGPFGFGKWLLDYAENGAFNILLAELLRVTE